VPTPYDLYYYSNPGSPPSSDANNPGCNSVQLPFSPGTWLQIGQLQGLPEGKYLVFAKIPIWNLEWAYEFSPFGVTCQLFAGDNLQETIQIEGTPRFTNRCDTASGGNHYGYSFVRFTTYVDLSGEKGPTDVTLQARVTEAAGAKIRVGWPGNGSGALNGPGSVTLIALAFPNVYSFSGQNVASNADPIPLEDDDAQLAALEPSQFVQASDGQYYLVIASVPLWNTSAQWQTVTLTLSAGASNPQTISLEVPRQVSTGGDGNPYCGIWGNGHYGYSFAQLTLAALLKPTDRVTLTGALLAPAQPGQTYAGSPPSGRGWNGTASTTLLALPMPNDPAFPLRYFQSSPGPFGNAPGGTDPWTLAVLDQLPPGDYLVLATIPFCNIKVDPSESDTVTANLLVNGVVVTEGVCEGSNQDQYTLRVEPPPVDYDWNRAYLNVFNHYGYAFVQIATFISLSDQVGLSEIALQCQGLSPDDMWAGWLSSNPAPDAGVGPITLIALPVALQSTPSETARLKTSNKKRGRRPGNRR
jgi:hypothetical protein